MFIMKIKFYGLTNVIFFRVVHQHIAETDIYNLGMTSAKMLEQNSFATEQSCSFF